MTAETPLPPLSREARVERSLAAGADVMRRRRERLERAGILAAVFWAVALVWWAIVGYAEIRVADAIITLQGAERGLLVTADNHDTFASLRPQLDALGVAEQTSIAWFVILAFAALVGGVVAAAIAMSRSRWAKRVVAGMSIIWLAVVTVGISQGETLSLMTWITN